VRRGVGAILSAASSVYKMGRSVCVVAYCIDSAIYVVVDDFLTHAKSYMC
jgi:hypothetical protein